MRKPDINAVIIAALREVAEANRGTSQGSHALDLLAKAEARRMEALQHKGVAYPSPIGRA